MQSMGCSALKHRANRVIHKLPLLVGFASLHSSDAGPGTPFKVYPPHPAQISLWTSLCPPKSKLEGSILTLLNSSFTIIHNSTQRLPSASPLHFSVFKKQRRHSEESPLNAPLGPDLADWPSLTDIPSFPSSPSPGGCPFYRSAIPPTVCHVPIVSCPVRATSR